MSDAQPQRPFQPATERLAYQRLYVNIDHVATLRQARRSDEPDPVAAARVCEAAGADGITVHLREDRRHIQDDDVERLAPAVRTVLNLEIAATDEMIALALRLRPHQVTIVPERREEVTTEGGLDVRRGGDRLRHHVGALVAAGLRTSLFVGPDADAVRATADLGAAAVELHTGPYAHAPHDPATRDALAAASRLAVSLGLAVHAGHGLTADNVGPVAAIPEIEELNIGHSIVSRAVFIGLDASARAVRDAMDAARGGAMAPAHPFSHHG